MDYLLILNEVHCNYYKRVFFMQIFHLTFLTFRGLLRVVDKTRDSTTSKICLFLLTLIAHVESGQILLFVEYLVLSTTIFTTINTYYTHNFVHKNVHSQYNLCISYANIQKFSKLVLSLISYLIYQTILK